MSKSRIWCDSGMDNNPSMVTVSGLPGSGTTTVCGVLQRHLGWVYLNAGAIFRQLAAEAGLDLATYGRRAELDGSIDCRLDARMVAMARQEGHAILEGRLTGWMAKRHQLPALRCWVDAPISVRAARVSQRDQQPLDEAITGMQQREASEAQRYKAFHSIDITEYSVYHVVLDSEHRSADQIADHIISCLREAGA